ncbi:hypothetical protein HDU87_004386 [Geranomyces variabilis]|uniref:Uncharacterized protein n=1 Tax=Geranomyces variabilis TaxID=109894 RepID=A0AAD5TIK4_9FUNG|nr:hypothetical protein HDU87_004386 [Geranomyces variabilis]
MGPPPARPANWLLKDIDSLLNFDNPSELSSAPKILSHRSTRPVPTTGIQPPIFPKSYVEWSDIRVSTARQNRELVIAFCKERKYHGLWIVVEEAPKVGSTPPSLVVDSSQADGRGAPQGYRAQGPPGQPLLNLVHTSPEEWNDLTISDLRAKNPEDEDDDGFVATIYVQKKTTMVPRQVGVGVDQDPAAAQMLAWLVAMSKLEETEEEWCAQHRPVKKSGWVN